VTAGVEQDLGVVFRAAVLVTHLEWYILPPRRVVLRADHTVSIDVRSEPISEELYSNTLAGPRLRPAYNTAADKRIPILNPPLGKRFGADGLQPNTVQESMKATAMPMQSDIVSEAVAAVPGGNVPQSRPFPNTSVPPIN
jgi:hypothetical protein